MVTELIFVGTELLLGDIVNTNAQYMSQRLADLGVSVYFQTVVGDNRDRLLGCLEMAQKRSQVVILCGGLGPTPDDITKETLGEHVNRPMVKDEKAMAVLEGYFKRRNISASLENDKQAFIPEGATVLENENGTAPGIMYQDEACVYFVLPGPPVEMKLMFENYITPFFRAKNPVTLVSKTLKLIGIGESVIAKQLQDVMETSQNPTLAPYAKMAEVHLRITAMGTSRDEALEKIDAMVTLIWPKVAPYVYCDDDRDMVEFIMDQLRQHHYTLAVAESCTGGLLANAFVEKSGASDVFMSGLITYSNEAKTQLLGIPAELIEQDGAVSESVASLMAQQVAHRMMTDVGVGITGVAGPTGGTQLKPVGLVFISTWIKGQSVTKAYHLTGNRQKIRDNAVKYALIQLLEGLKNIN